MTTITRDDTIHDVEYVTKHEALLEIDAANHRGMIAAATLRNDDAAATAGCAKCGSSDIHRKYYAEGEDTNGVWPNRKGKSSAWVNRKDAYFQPALHECIVHTCRCCGYSWDSDSLPNDKAEALSLSEVDPPVAGSARFTP